MGCWTISFIVFLLLNVELNHIAIVVCVHYIMCSNICQQKPQSLLYRNCGFCLAEMESQGSKGCAFLHPTRQHSRLRSFTRSLRILLVFSQSRSGISFLALYEFIAQWTVATAHKKQAVSPEPTKSWLSDENRLTSDEQSSICHCFGNCVFMTHKIIITMPNIWPRISSIDV